jgi:transposase
VLTLPPAVRIHLAVDPIDIRRSFDGLSTAVREVLKDDPFSGHVFIFRNKRSDMLKLIWWSTGGFTILYKRLERGTFHLLPREFGRADRAVKIDAVDLAMMLDGVELAATRRRRRWTPSVEGELVLRA